MAWSFISEAPMTAEQYDELNGAIRDDPQGLILHTASRAHGGMRIVDVWDSEDAYRRFEREELLPAMQRLGMAPPEDAPAVQGFELHNLRGRAA